MLKRKITKAEYDALAEAVRAFYQADGDSFALKLEVSADDDPAELRRARDREKQEAKEQRERAERLQREKDELVANPEKLKDITTLENSWKLKLEDQKTADDKRVARREEQLKRTLVVDVAEKLAMKIAGDNSALLQPHIERRLQANLDGDTPSTRVLDSSGALSAATLEDFEKEIRADKRFSAIVIVSNANGGANGNKGGGKGGAPTDKKFSELNDQERTEFFKRDPEGFKAAAAAAKVR